MESVQTFAKLIEIMNRIRKECPWDNEQTHDSLRQYFIEETYEAIEALDQKDWGHLKKELGDVLWQIIFHSIIAEENRIFNLNDVICELNDKMINRHPHVFGDTSVNSAADVEQNWETIKKRDEGKKSYLDGVPKSLPALLRAQNLQRKAAAVGFDWPEIEPVWEKLREEETEFKSALLGGDKNEIEAELGDILFTWVNITRHLKINAEDALRSANRKFENRFKALEKKIKTENEEISNLNIEKLDHYWKKVKLEEG